MRERDHKSITLHPEAAEAMDLQHETDRLWFETNPGAVYFRHALPGEWDSHRIAGAEPPCLGPIHHRRGPNGQWHVQPDFIRPQLSWTAVVDVGRALAMAEGSPMPAACGVRMRLASTPMLSRRDRKDAETAAIAYVVRAMGVLKQAPRQP